MSKNNFHISQLLRRLCGGVVAVGVMGALLSGCVFAAEKARNVGLSASDRASYQMAAAQQLPTIDFSAATVQTPKNRGHINDKLILPLSNGKKSTAIIWYEDGNKSGRYAKVVADPAGGDNKVLHFWLNKAQIEGQRSGNRKGRIQLNMSGLRFTEAYQRFRVYLHPDLAHYRSFKDHNSWFTIDEFWFGKKGRHPHPFRITLGIIKEAGVGAPLVLGVSGEVAAGGRKGHGKWASIWHDIGYGVELPVGEWIDVEIGYRQGDKKTGHFEVSIKRKNDPKMITVLSINDWTYNPKASKPVPLTAWNPLKLYTSSQIIDHIRNKGGVAQLYFDDLDIRASKERR